MRGVFDEEEDLEHEKSHRDTEVTLGAGMLLMLFFGLVLVCGLCFGLGYAIGHHAAFSQQASAGSQPAASPSASSIPKPSALAQAPPSAVPAPDSSAAPAAEATGQPQPTTAVAVPIGSSAQPATPSTPANPSAAQSQVHPALPLMTNQPAPINPPAAQPVRPPAMPYHPATNQPQLWVQIAAVSHVEDAEVLTNALRRRGYTVTPRREPADNLIHVRIGPFATHDEANQWRMKLLNDGYNAEVQP